MISAIILSGGNATRMGGEKPFRKLNNNYLIENIANVLIEMNIPFTVVFKHLNNLDSENIQKQHYMFEKYRQTITWDILNNKGPIIGILSGMRILNTEWVIVLPCDMPLISKISIDKLLNYIPIADSKKYDCIIPKHENGYIEPLFSIYKKSSIRILEELVKISIKEDKTFPIRRFIDELNPLYVPVDEIDPTKKTFVNVNTHDDLKVVKKEVKNKK
ncbi:molybdenum cofactor guanylyltransferase [Methanothermococcus sp.]|uniref:molybdenum cofactor guanylyltransferase n=1 Tax=Methanothermococcus sp. TaxID=2614238 RepID=UPI0025D505DD|nr:molybdenum cofactor guanylyltransferase [Methanothermococcus sp.]